MSSPASASTEDSGFRHSGRRLAAFGLGRRLEMGAGGLAPPVAARRYSVLSLERLGDGELGCVAGLGRDWLAPARKRP